MNDVILLGTGRAAALGVAAKAAMLDRAGAAGIDVPPGLIVTPGADPAAIGSPDLFGPTVVVRSAFGAEDRADASLAGHFLTELDIPHDEVAASIDRVRASASGHGPMRTDVMVMRGIDPVVAGVAFSEDGYEDDLVNAVGGRADGLLAGAEAGQGFRLARLRRAERAGLQLAPWQRRLSALLRSVRSEFGPGSWDVEWADDGATCWLLQVRPVTAPPQRNEAFTIANHKEILPELPSTLMASLVESAAHELLDFYASLDPTLPVHRPFVETFAGRPYLNLSMLTDLMRALGLPTRLVTDSYGGAPDVEVGLRPRRMAASARSLARIAAAQAGAVGRARGVAASLRATTVPGDASWTETIAILRESYLALVNEMGALASAIAPPVALLRAAGTLDTHLARQRTAATEMLDALAPIAEIASEDPDAIARLGPRGDAASRTGPRHEVDGHWVSWLDDHGHRGVFESDVARPRFGDDPTPIIDAVRHGRLPTPATERRSLRTVATLPIWAMARTPMAAREQVRSAGMRAFGAVRAQLVRLAEEAVDRGALPDVDAVWLLSIDEACSLDDGGRCSPEETERRRAARSQLEELRLPDTIHRFDELDDDRSRASVGRSSCGLPLVRGTVDGVALRASEPPSRLPDGFDPATTILVARSVDAGWIGTFTQVAGVAVEIGGDLSHGSIILRELGVISVTNLGDLGDGIATGDHVRLDATTGRLELLDPVDHPEPSTIKTPAAADADTESHAPDIATTPVA